MQVAPKTQGQSVKLAGYGITEFGTTFNGMVNSCERRRCEPLAFPFSQKGFGDMSPQKIFKSESL